MEFVLFNLAFSLVVLSGSIDQVQGGGSGQDCGKEQWLQAIGQALTKGPTGKEETNLKKAFKCAYENFPEWITSKAQIIQFCGDNLKAGAQKQACDHLAAEVHVTLDEVQPFFVYFARVSDHYGNNPAAIIASEYNHHAETLMNWPKVMEVCKRALNEGWQQVHQALCTAMNFKKD